jgi:hypothetical protein
MSVPDDIEAIQHLYNSDSDEDTKNPATMNEDEDTKMPATMNTEDADDMMPTSETIDITMNEDDEDTKMPALPVPPPVLDLTPECEERENLFVGIRVLQELLGYAYEDVSNFSVPKMKKYMGTLQVIARQRRVQPSESLVTTVLQEIVAETTDDDIVRRLTLTEFEVEKLEKEFRQSVDKFNGLNNWENSLKHEEKEENDKDDRGWVFRGDIDAYPGVNSHMDFDAKVEIINRVYTPMNRLKFPRTVSRDSRPLFASIKVQKPKDFLTDLYRILKVGRSCQRKLNLNLKRLWIVGYNLNAIQTHLLLKWFKIYWLSIKLLMITKNALKMSPSLLGEQMNKHTTVIYLDCFVTSGMDKW